jgi:membrane fusion protein, multidrug efflux system
VVSTRIGQRSPIRTVLITAVALAVVLGGIYVWHGTRTEAPRTSGRPPVTVATMVVKPADAPAFLKAVGTLTAVREVVITPEVGGLVTGIRFESGDNVEANALLLQLNDAPERANRNAAQAKADLAQLQLTRAQRLVRTGAQSREVLEQRGSERDQALATVKQFDALIAQKQIRAPFAGELGLRRIDLGQHLNPGDPIVTLTDLNQLYVEFAVPQQDLGQIKLNGMVTVTTDGLAGRTFTGEVNAIEPQIDINTRNVTVQALLPNSERVLRPGMYVDVALNLPTEHDVLLVPVTAIQTSASGDSIIVVRGASPEQGGTADVVPVTTGRRIGNQVVIASGLKAGDVVVTAGQLRVQAGANVTPVSSAQAGDH